MVILNYRSEGSGPNRIAQKQVGLYYLFYSLNLMGGGGAQTWEGGSNPQANHR